MPCRNVRIVLQLVTAMTLSRRRVVGFWWCGCCSMCDAWAQRAFKYTQTTMYMYGLSACLVAIYFLKLCFMGVCRRYAYIGQHPRGPPSTKHTDQVLRIQSPNLLDLPSAGATSTAATATISDDSQPRPLRFHFDIYGATHSTIAEEIRANVPLT